MEFIFISFGSHIQAFQLSIGPEMEFPGPTVHIGSQLLANAKQFSKEVVQIYSHQ